MTDNKKEIFDLLAKPDGKKAVSINFDTPVIVNLDTLATELTARYGKEISRSSLVNIFCKEGLKAHGI